MNSHIPNGNGNKKNHTKKAPNVFSLRLFFIYLEIACLVIDSSANQMQIKLGKKNENMFYQVMKYASRELKKIKVLDILSNYEIRQP